jgi:hypothetical protein
MNMRLRLADLDPHFIREDGSPVDYAHSDDIDNAEGLQLKCPACHWAARGLHTIMLWKDPRHWGFVCHGYGDLSLMAGSVTAMMTVGRCHARLYIKDGKVDFY